ncbi:MAG: hypothetical protein LBQ89_03960 [Treponema sp.]|jgi:hypothetical protein|nr:hypothetical protein [Treponema sp.]
MLKNNGKEQTGMGINFTVKDIMHEVSAKFVRTFLPTAKEVYNMRAVRQPDW